ncbi:MAG: epoxyqueuosine reductase, partial [Proteobacteria bacterium]|nr:epoxyqueuosine reductase [Pseudomonadota bacterium]
AEEFRRPLGNRIFGCDDCLAVCPWNRFAKTAHQTWLGGGATMPPLAELLTLNETSFRQRFKASPVKRTGFTRLMRNVLIAAGNSGDPGLLPAITPYLTHHEALLRGMAVWAARQLLPPAEFKHLAAQHNYTQETDKNVRHEWQAGLG